MIGPRIDGLSFSLSLSALIHTRAIYISRARIYSCTRGGSIYDDNDDDDDCFALYCEGERDLLFALGMKICWLRCARAWVYINIRERVLF